MKTYLKSVSAAMMHCGPAFTRTSAGLLKYSVRRDKGVGHAACYSQSHRTSIKISVKQRASFFSSIKVDLHKRNGNGPAFRSLAAACTSHFLPWTIKFQEGMLQETYPPSPLPSHYHQRGQQ
jgi:hypothetical protein